MIKRLSKKIGLLALKKHNLYKLNKICNYRITALRGKK